MSTSISSDRRKIDFLADSFWLYSRNSWIVLLLLLHSYAIPPIYSLKKWCLQFSSKRVPRAFGLDQTRKQRTTHPIIQMTMTGGQDLNDSSHDFQTTLFSLFWAKNQLSIHVMSGDPIRPREKPSELEHSGRGEIRSIFMMNDQAVRHASLGITIWSKIDTATEWQSDVQLDFQAVKIPATAKSYIILTKLCNRPRRIHISLGYRFIRFRKELNFHLIVVQSLEAATDWSNPRRLMERNS